MTIIAVTLNPDQTIAEEKEVLLPEDDLSQLYVVDENELTKLQKYVPDVSDLTYTYEINEVDKTVNLRVDPVQVDVEFVKQQINTEINERHQYLWEVAVSRMYQFLELSDNVEKLIAYFDQIELNKQSLIDQAALASTLTESLNVPTETWPAFAEETFTKGQPA